MRATSPAHSAPYRNKDVSLVVLADGPFYASWIDAERQYCRQQHLWPDGKFKALPPFAVPPRVLVDMRVVVSRLLVVPGRETRLYAEEVPLWVRHLCQFEQTRLFQGPLRSQLTEDVPDLPCVLCSCSDSKAIFRPSEDNRWRCKTCVLAWHHMCARSAFLAWHAKALEDTPEPFVCPSCAWPSKPVK